jgi:hypothetical protein
MSDSSQLVKIAAVVISRLMSLLHASIAFSLEIFNALYLRGLKQGDTQQMIKAER